MLTCSERNKMTEQSSSSVSVTSADERANITTQQRVDMWLMNNMQFPNEKQMRNEMSFVSDIESELSWMTGESSDSDCKCGLKKCLDLYQAYTLDFVKTILKINKNYREWNTVNERRKTQRTQPITSVQSTTVQRNISFGSNKQHDVPSKQIQQQNTEKSKHGNQQGKDNLESTTISPKPASGNAEQIVPNENATRVQQRQNQQITSRQKSTINQQIEDIVQNKQGHILSKQSEQHITGRSKEKNKTVRVNTSNISTHRSNTTEEIVQKARTEVGKKILSTSTHRPTLFPGKSDYGSSSSMSEDLDAEQRKNIRNNNVPVKKTRNRSVNKQDNTSQLKSNVHKDIDTSKRKGSSNNDAPGNKKARKSMHSSFKIMPTYPNIRQNTSLQMPTTKTGDASNLSTDVTSDTLQPSFMYKSVTEGFMNITPMDKSSDNPKAYMISKKKYLAMMGMRRNRIKENDHEDILRQAKQVPPVPLFDDNATAASSTSLLQSFNKRSSSDLWL